MSNNIQTNLDQMRFYFGSHHKWINNLDRGYVWGDGNKIDQFLKQCIANKFTKVTNLLEIAVGYGRLTNSLFNYCDNLYGIDLNNCCVDYCSKVFPNGIFKQCDGISIPFDNVLFDAVISYDSMVHFEPIIIEKYLENISKITNSGAYIILHHAASGDTNIGMRSNMTSGIMSIFALKYNFKIIEQIYSWKINDYAYNDCITILQK
jgi:ubiquinone/menaquinone biosynthesis C-methylase UbiE